MLILASFRMAGSHLNGRSGRVFQRFCGVFAVIHIRIIYGKVEGLERSERQKIIGKGI